MATVMDLHTKKIVGYSFFRSLTAVLVIRSLEHACYTQRPKKGLIFYSDLGTQHTSEAFAETIKKFGMIDSLSYIDSPYDNSCIDSFHTILMKEEVNHVAY